MRLNTSTTATRISPEDRKTWTQAFTILLIVSILILIMRLRGNPFLATDFEVAVIYFPTALAGFAALYVNITSRIR